MVMVRSSYEIAADDILAVLLMNKTEYQRIRFEYGLLPNFMPEGYHRKVTEALYWLYENDKPIHDTLIVERVPELPLGWLAQRFSLYDETRINEVTKENCAIVRDEGLLIGTRNLLRTADCQLEERGAKARLSVVQNLTSLLTTIGQNAQIKDVLASQHGKKNRLLDAQSRDGVPTAIPYLDSHTNGYEFGHIWWIGGAYKGRKTTLGLNMALGMALARLSGESVMNPAILSGEMEQGRVQRQLEAMLAIAYIHKTGYYGKVYRNHNDKEVGYDWIDASLIKAMNIKYAHYEGQDRLTAYQKDLGHIRGAALHWAQETYDSLPLRVYDSTPEHGALSNYEAIDMVINMDMANHRGNWFVLDYLQLFDFAQAKSNGIFERISAMSRALQLKAKQKKILLIVLAQLNEDTIKNADESQSAGIKGGGDPAATADYFLRTVYNDGKLSENEEQLYMQLRLSRHGASGKNKFDVLDIHPKSGLILGQDWIERI